MRQVSCAFIATITSLSPLGNFIRAMCWTVWSPGIKLASNSEVARRMSDDIDYDCGPVLNGAKSLTECGEDVFRLMLETASGKKSASEVNGFGDLEFVPWQPGITL
jgi:altronate hydrolase